MQFPFGNAALALLVLAVGSGGAIYISQRAAPQERPDLVLATFAQEHADAYRPALAAFENAHHVKVQVQVVSQTALKGRLQSAMQVGAELPDLVELIKDSMGTFTSGPLDDIGLVDLTDRIHTQGLDKTLVTNRFGLWSTRGHIFALPHDVHPIMLAYRKDLTDALGIDVSKLQTWDDFVRVGREVTKDLDGDGNPDRYMIDLPADGGDAIRLLMLQRGARLFDENGNVVFDDPVAVDVVCWYVRQTVGKDRISFPCGWGQTLSRAMIDGLCLFYICPDWRTKQFENDVPTIKGKLALMPMPRWTADGPNTSTWGGTGMAITKACKKQDLAWQLAMYLYYDPDQLGPRFANTNILPPLKTAWTHPEFNAPDPYFGGLARGRAFVELAPQVPSEPSSTYIGIASGKMSEAFQNVSLYYQAHGDDGLEAYATKEMKRCADRVRVIAGRNVFMKSGAAR